MAATLLGKSPTLSLHEPANPSGVLWRPPVPSHVTRELRAAPEGGLGLSRAKPDTERGQHTCEGVSSQNPKRKWGRSLPTTPLLLTSFLNRSPELVLCSEIILSLASHIPLLHSLCFSPPRPSHSLSLLPTILPGGDGQLHSSLFLAWAVLRHVFLLWAFGLLLPPKQQR